ncbi:uncharacterized protein LOC127378593 isoform X22 [Dicentrarchus labrax]|uniref:uncharacterized protein LOC127378593 isoform X21 n=1 Tax=Dicentrarchus labrax TaxID=13489 RepID=UPI0021F614E4|nr:uncharacterized protein LOC127378593 isoform X21 [Dicentrarchus labrax]XP_051283548.1 uncharacterized protein LOC127378593 isoform X22 [Dicentrarchus labrax]
MASTTQSARDYVENARVHLVRELKNLSVIVENLYQQKVFSDEEVSKIQTERDDFEKTRKILDSVTKKGEAACYKFLRIIDMTRKRTVERASVLPEKQSAASTENRKFDLHHWISCYPFKEDTQMDVNYLQGSRPCHRYQAKLKSKAQKISNKFWMANKNLFEGNNPNLSYTALVLDKQGGDSPSKIKKLKSKKRKLSRPKKMKTYIPKDRPGTSPSDLLKTDENILLVGKPGIGKTALSHELLRLWAERDNEELDYMFYFDMRETSHITRAMSLEDLLFSVFSEPDEGREEVLQDIKRNSDNVTIIFDGITDLSSSVVKKLVEKDLLPDAKVIVTCRPDNEEDFGDFLRVEVKGFSEQTIKTYLSAMLGDTQKKVLSNLELLTLCHVPMYALMVAACFSSETPEDSSQPCSITEIYINIVRFCLKMNSNKTKNKDLNSFIENKSEEILSLAEVAFHATEGKTVNLTKLPHKDSCVLCFLKSLDSQGAPTETITTYAFLHYTMQEFFAAIWLLKNPDKIKEVFQQCLTTEKKHMKHLIPFMCRLLTDKSPSLMKCLIPAQELINTSNWFFKEMINRFFPYLCETDEADTEDSGLDVDILFLCQCLFESQCPEACVYFLDKLDYRLDLSGESLGPYPCCAVAYVVTQSKEKKIYLNLEDVMVSEQGMRRLFGCLQNVQWCDPLPRQLWEVFLLSEEQMDYRRLLGLGSNQLHLPVEGKRRLFERAVKVMQKISTQVNVCLHCDRATPACQRLHESLLEALPYISSLSFSHRFRVTGQAEFFGNLFCAAAEREQQTGEKILELLSSVCRYQTFPLKEKWCDFQLDLYSYGCETGLSVLPSLQSVLQSAPAVWSINLSERKTSILLEVLKLQSEKKQVELTGCSHEESEVRSFLQCLPYISQFSFVPQSSDRYEETKFFGNLFCAAAEREQQTGEKILELLSLVCSYKTFPLKEKWWDFLLDLYSYGCETGLSVLPSLQSVLQSAPAVWSINLSERKPSILLEVLKLQSEKKQVKLTGCSHEESEVRSFLQCLPYISQLSFVPQSSDRYEETKFFGNLFCAAAEREQQTGEKILELLSSVCSYKTFPLKEKWWDFLLDLYSYGCETGLSVLPSLQSVLQSAPAVWSINLSERKPSILLEVLKLQSEKKQVKLTGCSHEEIEVRSFLQCLPYISQLSFVPQSSDRYEETKFFGNLFCAAAEREQQTGEKILELLSSVCSYKTFPLKEKWWDFLLDLYSYYCETGLSVLPSLQSVLQSAPAVWSINLSERKPSILLEVLKLQSEKKPVELTGCSYEESEVRSFLQCLPYISQLSVCYWLKGEAKFFGNLFCAAAEREQQTGEKILELLSSVCRYKTFPLNDRYMDYDANKHQCDVLLDLYSHLKDYETKTGLSVLPSLQSVLQSAPAVWFINLSERKTSILLEVLKLQSEKKQVKLTGCSHEESEVRSFLQCLPYISQLSVCYSFEGEAKFFGNLFCAAAEREQQTGEKILELLSSVCRYKTFPLNEEDDDVEEYQCDFLLDLYSHLKDYETKTGLSVLPSLQSVLQSAPAVWFINLSERKTSILLEVLKLQSEKKQVELTGCSHEESEVRSFLQCLPYISQLSCDPEFFQSVCTLISVRSREDEEQLSSLLQLLGYTLQLTGELHTGTCRSVGRVLRLCGSDVDLILKPRKMSVRGASLLFRHTTQLHSLSLSSDMALLLFQWVRRGRAAGLLAIEELSLTPQTVQPSERVLLKVVSSLASLLRYWSVRQLDLTEFYVPAQGLIPLLLHHGPLTIKLREKISLQLLSLIHEIQDKDLTQLFLSKVGGDLSSCCLNWELLHCLLQQSLDQIITVNLRKNRFLQENVTRLLPFLDKIVVKRPCPRFVLTAIREIYKACASPIIPSLLRSLDHVINLTCREMDSVDCAALLFTLKHSDRVKLNLVFTSIPTGQIESILFTLDKVSQLSVDRNLLLRFIHCCAASDAQQGAAVGLLRALQHRLDLSCSSCVDLPEEGQSETLSLTAEDCRAVSTILRRSSSKDTQLNLQDCELEDSRLDLLFPVLDRVRLRASKALLLQLLSLVPMKTERDTVRRAVSLCRALGGELDLSHTTLDQRACEALAQMLDFSEGLTDLDLSHCELTDQLLFTLITHLHKVQVLDLSHNKITDAAAHMLLQLVSINPSIDTVRLFSNNIVNRNPFKKHQQFEIW